MVPQLGESARPAGGKQGGASVGRRCGSVLVPIFRAGNLPDRIQRRIVSGSLAKRLAACGTVSIRVAHYTSSSRWLQPSSWHELERVDVEWPHGSEMPLIQRRDLGLADALGERHHAGIDKADRQVSIVSLQVSAAG